MLFGEHAVLQKKHALVCALDARLTVFLKKRIDDVITITASMGSYRTSIKDIAMQAPCTFVTQAISSVKEALPSGFDLEIVSEISPNFGLGSSSAVTVATHAALLAWLENGCTREVLFQRSLATIRAVQKLGSGADAASSVYGGVVLYKADPLYIEPIDCCFDLSVFYSKSKMATPQVVQKVLHAKEQHPEIFDMLFDAMDKVTLQASSYLKSGAIEKLGALCTIHQGLQDALGVNTVELSEIIYHLRQDPNIIGAKISGSGLGDCAIGIGKTDRTIKDYPQLHVQIANSGVEIG